MNIVTILTHLFDAQHSHEHDEDSEFGEYDEFETLGVAGTAVPHIPDPEPSKPVESTKATKKHVHFDDEEFEGISIGTTEPVKEQTEQTLAEQCTPLLAFLRSTP